MPGDGGDAWDREPGAGVPWAGRLRPGKPPLGAAGDPPLLADEAPLPWLEAPDAFDDVRGGIGLARFLVFGFLLLALVVGGVWWMVRDGEGSEPDGSLIRAESGPYKVRPEAPGGKTFAGTGDSAYAVSEGQRRGAELADRADASDLGDDPAADAGGGFAVQVGAFMDAAAAEAGWASVVQRNPMLSGVAHRVVAARGDIGTLYRLQAVTGSAAAASGLCQALRDAGQECQVRR